MALKFHPDKNHAPEAEDAFKAVSSAYACLSDARKREYYNAHGREEGRGQGGSAAGGSGGPYYEAQDITPEEMFNMFFNPGGGGRRFYSRRRFYQHSGGDHNESPRTSLFQLAHFLPLILLFVFTFMSSATTEESPFGLDRSPVYNIEKLTPTGTVYWVSSNFQRRYGRDFRALAQVEAQADQQFF